MAYLQWQKRIICRDWEPTNYAASTETDTMANVSVTDLVGAAFTYISESFNGSNSDAKVEVGDGVDPNRFITSTNSDAVNTGLKQGTGAGFAACPGYLYTAADTIDIKYTEDTGTDTTTGICDVWVYIAHGIPYA
jgi:hypothetical protein